MGVSTCWIVVGSLGPVSESEVPAKYCSSSEPMETKCAEDCPGFVPPLARQGPAIQELEGYENTLRFCSPWTIKKPAPLARGGLAVLQVPAYRYVHVPIGIVPRRVQVPVQGGLWVFIKGMTKIWFSTWTLWVREALAHASIPNEMTAPWTKANTGVPEVRHPSVWSPGSFALDISGKLRFGYDHDQATIQNQDQGQVRNNLKRLLKRSQASCA